jgi:hypothetical protein
LYSANQNNFSVMKKWLLLVFLGMIFPMNLTQIIAQESFDDSFQEIDKELREWDPVRGKWLSASIKANTNGEAIPDRTFPEDLTPSEMLALVPDQRIDKLKGIARTNETSTRDLIQQKKWNNVNRYLNTPRCSPVMARSYGDPHLKSFDGASFSFQTVGEFTLVKGNDHDFEVQARQAARQSDFSLNTAVAVNAGGDRVAVYGNDRPDGRQSGIYVNGSAIDIRSETYFLPRGGTLRQSGKNVEVTAPTGEKVSLDSRRSGGMTFYNVAVQVYPCSEYNYDGLFGDVNGNRNDDFNRRSSTGTIASTFGTDVMGGNLEKERLAFIARDLGDHWRVTNETSLFDYGFGENTMTYTDHSFPRVHRTVNDIPANRRNDARRRCEERGINGADLNACIYDNAFLAIEPIGRPVMTDRTRNVVLGRVDREVRNVNPPLRPTETQRKVPETRKIPTGRTIDIAPTEKVPPTVRKLPVTNTAGENPDARNTNVNNETKRESTSLVKPNQPEVKTNSTFRKETKPSTRTMPPRTATPSRKAPMKATPARSAPTKSIPARSAPSRSKGGGRGSL